MEPTLQPLRDEHRRLFPTIEAIREAADEVGTAPCDELAARLEDLDRFLTGHLLPHAAAEEAVLYPAVARLLGDPAATATMSLDHAAIERLGHDLATLLRAVRAGDVDDRVVHGLRATLYGLYQLLLVHFAKEEEVYVPLLEARLDGAQTERLLADLHDAADRGREAGDQL